LPAIGLDPDNLFTTHRDNPIAIPPSPKRPYLLFILIHFTASIRSNVGYLKINHNAKTTKRKLRPILIPDLGKFQNPTLLLEEILEVIHRLFTGYSQFEPNQSIVLIKNTSPSATSIFD